MPRGKKTTTTTSAPSVPEKTVKIAKATTTRAKADVSEAFAEIQQEVFATENMDSKVAELLKVQQEAVEKTAAGLSVEKVVNDLSALGLSTQRSFDQVRASLTEVLNNLQSVSNAVELKRKELLALHEVDVAATSVKDLVEEYQNKSKTFEEDAAAVREAWKKEQANHAQMLLERNQEVEKQRKREVDEYNYTTTRDRQQAQDRFEEGLAKRAKEVKEKEDALLRDWSRRENELSSREEEFSAYKKQVETMPETLKQEVAKAEAILRNTLTKDFNNQTALAAKQFEADKRVLELQVASQQATLSDKDRMIADLQSQLRTALDRVEKIASNAFESVSGKKALEVATQMSRDVSQSSGSKK